MYHQKAVASTVACGLTVQGMRAYICQPALPFLVRGTRKKGENVNRETVTDSQLASYSNRERVLHRRLLQGELPVDHVVSILECLIDGDVRTIGKRFVDGDRYVGFPQSWGRGWRVENQRPCGLVDLRKIGLASVPACKKEPKSGHAILEAVKNKKLLSVAVLEHLTAHPEFIPPDWKGKAVYFLATDFRGPDGDLYARCICWRGKWDTPRRSLSCLWQEEAWVAVAS